MPQLHLDAHIPAQAVEKERKGGEERDLHQRVELLPVEGHQGDGRDKEQEHADKEQHAQSALGEQRAPDPLPGDRLARRGGGLGCGQRFGGDGDRLFLRRAAQAQPDLQLLHSLVQIGDGGLVSRFAQPGILLMQSSQFVV